MIKVYMTIKAAFDYDTPWMFRFSFFYITIKHIGNFNLLAERMGSLAIRYIEYHQHCKLKPLIGHSLTEMANKL